VTCIVIGFPLFNLAPKLYRGLVEYRLGAMYRRLRAPLATISGAYTADFAEAPVGAMRLKRANEGAIRASITQFLDRLRTMK
jgi:hypothetical protein